MMECWTAEADKRPGFDDLYNMLDDILNQNEVDFTKRQIDKLTSMQYLIT
jgi:hypothetical protein